MLELLECNSLLFISPILVFQLGRPNILSVTVIDVVEISDKMSLGCSDNFQSINVKVPSNCAAVKNRD